VQEWVCDSKALESFQVIFNLETKEESPFSNDTAGAIIGQGTITGHIYRLEENVFE
jgi:hypothetical protein